MFFSTLAFFLAINLLVVHSGTKQQANVATKTTISPTSVSLASTTTRRPFLPGLKIPCNCASGECGCCMNILQGFFRQKACLNVSYEPDEFAFNIRMIVNDNVLYKNTFSGKNPPPFCVPVPRFRFIEFCVRFYNIYFARRNVHMCINADASWEDFTLLEWSFDCIRLGANGVAAVGVADGGGLPPSLIDTEDQTDEDYDDSARNVPMNGSNALKERAPVNATFTKGGDILLTVDEDYEFSVK